MQSEVESPTLLKIDSMCADVTGKPDSALAMQLPYAAHALLQSFPLAPTRQYAPRTAIPVGVDKGRVGVAAHSTHARIRKWLQQTFPQA